MTENEHEHHDEKRIDFESELGMSRRDLLRRSAIVGGTLLWAAPVMQSLTQKAYAADGRVSGGTCAACYCYTDRTRKDGSVHVRRDKGKVDQQQNLSAQDCQDFCSGFKKSSYCTGKTIHSCTVHNEQGQNFPSESAQLAAAINCNA